MGLASNPVCTLFRDCPLSELILEPKLEVRTKESFFLCRLGNVKLSQFSLGLIGYFTGDKGRSCEDELEAFDLLQLLLQCLISVDREARCRDRNLGAGSDGPFQVISDEAIHIV